LLREQIADLKLINEEYKNIIKEQRELISELRKS
jgi:hypothetical protein